MAMRYLIRRPKPDDLSEIRKRVSDLDTQLGPAADGFRRTITVSFSPMRSANYSLTTRKVGENWTWICAGIELSADDEVGLFALTDTYQVPRPTHLVGRTEVRK